MSKEDKQMANKHMKRSSAPFIIREMKSNQIKTTVRYCFVCTRMAKIKKSMIVVGEDMEKLEPLYVAGGTVNVIAT